MRFLRRVAAAGPDRPPSEPGFVRRHLAGCAATQPCVAGVAQKWTKVSQKGTLNTLKVGRRDTKGFKFRTRAKL
jgi:hypothetical protein